MNLAGLATHKDSPAVVEVGKGSHGARKFSVTDLSG